MSDKVATTRREALKRGLRFYFTGRRCKRWDHDGRHGDRRYATTGRCSQCTIRDELKRKRNAATRLKSKAARRQRRYYVKNKAKIALRNQGYWSRRRERRAAQLDFLNYVANGAPF